MKNKFILTEEESKRILSLHKQKIQEERGEIEEDDKGQSTGRIFAGSAAGAATGAGVGAIFGGVGAIPGSIIGAGVGALAGWMTTGGGYYDKVAKAFQFCWKHQKELGPPVNSLDTIRDIADNIRGAVEGFGRTDEVAILNNLKKLKTIPDFCKLREIYGERFNEKLLDALDGDIDQDTEWRDFVWVPLSELAKNTKKITTPKPLDDTQLKINAAKCGWGDDIKGYKDSGWRCPKEGGKPTPIPVPVPIVPNPRRRRYYFNYQDALNALNKKGCPTGGGGEEGKQEDSFADDWRATENKPVDTTVSTDNFSSWAN